ncbi:GNAT family N-acetyltransferase [uncultured Sphaerochaeta sp.]|uniref:GNAT family N-acetyltransferase n=1 Tax=uncultured Sphaerochaeta sp. TaxID=886478 RepID=UPI002AA60B2C|nr:GNAT family N-acetyltransferase [uncultured Sphaerochaeta sp.]
MKCYETERLSLRTITIPDIKNLQAFLVRNRTFLGPWEPLRDDTYYSEEAILQRIEQEILLDSQEKQLSLYLTRKGEERIIGNITLSNIVRGPFLFCFLGYKMDEEATGHGYMTEAVAKVVEIAFNDIRLHRIEANIMPRNKRSIQVVKKNGFFYEGVSKNYLKINGKWEDHAHYVLLNEELE